MHGFPQCILKWWMMKSSNSCVRSHFASLLALDAMRTSKPAFWGTKLVQGCPKSDIKAIKVLKISSCGVLVLGLLFSLYTFFFFVLVR